MRRRSRRDPLGAVPLPTPTVTDITVPEAVTTEAVTAAGAVTDRGCHHRGPTAPWPFHRSRPVARSGGGRTHHR